MKVKNARAAELSDFEVLQVLREMGKKQQLAILKNDENNVVGVGEKLTPTNGSINNSNPSENLTIEERTMQSLPSNLRTIQYEVLEYLNNIHRPCAHQKPDQITKFMDAIYAWERGKSVEGLENLHEQGGDPIIIEREKRLTKGEKLMLLNHAPTTEIELFPLVEEIEDRFTSEQRQDILTIIQTFIPLDHEAIQAYQNRNSLATSKSVTNEQESIENFDDQFEEDEDAGLQDPDEDMEMLENEGRGGVAVEDDGPEE